MRFRSIVLLGGVLVALIAVILLSEPDRSGPGGDGRPDDRELGLLIPGLAEPGAFVSEITWKLRGAGQYTVTRGGEGAPWLLQTDEGEIPCEAARIEELLLEARMCRVIEDLGEVSQQERLDYWLDPPSRTLEVVVDGERLTAHLGAEGVLKDVVYAARGGESGALLVEDSLTNTLDELDPKSLRRRRILDYRVSDVVHVSLEAGGETVFAAARADVRDEWRASVPFGDFVDPLKMDGDFLGEVLGLKAAEFSLDGASEGDLGRFGLDQPRYRVELGRIAARGGGRQVLLVGADDPRAPGRVFVMVEGGSSVFGCAASRLLAQLSIDPAVLRDRNLTRLGGTPLTRLVARHGDVSFEAVSEGGGWRLEKPERGGLEQDRVEVLLSLLRDFEVRSFVDGPDLAALGLAEPAGEVAVWTPVESGRERRPDEGPAPRKLAVRILLGKRSDDGGTYALREGYDGVAYVVDSRFVDLISSGHYPYKRLRVFNADFLKKEEVVIRREGAGLEPVEAQWTSEGWTNGIRGQPVAAIATKLSGLHAREWVGRAADREEKFGLGKSAALRLWLSFRDLVASGDEPLVFGVVVGKETEGGRFARAIREGKPEPDVFVLSEDVYKVFLQKLK